MKTGVVPEVEVSITDTTEDKAHMLLGTVQSNYRLIGVRVVITDGNDNTVMDETQFTAFSKYENVQTVQFARATVKEYDMNKFASAMSQIELEPGKEYHFESTAIVAGGREYPLKSFDFKY